MPEPIGFLNVLIVDDDPPTQVWIDQLVRKFGVDQVEAATTGTQAERMLRSGGFNCAIVDLDLPEGREYGLEILENPEFEAVFKIMLTTFTST